MKLENMNNTFTLKIWEESEILDHRHYGKEEGGSPGGLVLVESLPEEAGSSPAARDGEVLQLSQLYMRSTCRGQTSSRCINREQVHSDKNNANDHFWNSESLWGTTCLEWAFTIWCLWKL